MSGTDGVVVVVTVDGHPAVVVGVVEYGAVLLLATVGMPIMPVGDAQGDSFVVVAPPPYSLLVDVRCSQPEVMVVQPH